MVKDILKTNSYLPKKYNVYFNDFSSSNFPKIADEIDRQIDNLIDLDKYELFLRNKFKKPSFDIYAIFNPFNEAFRAFYPFISYLKNSLKDGDIILDLNNRTGWTTSFLAGIFPNQTIISMWEGNTDVLAYNGLVYWFGDAENATNVQIITSKLNQPLPFVDDSIALIVGFDVLHRQLRSSLLPEVNRVCTNDGLIFFPHVHTANAEPEPYFKRDGDLLQGHEYETFFRPKDEFDKTGYVFSEPDLFRFSKKMNENIDPNPNSADYNGTVALCSAKNNLTKKIKPLDYFKFFNLNEGFIILNPLIELNPNLKITLNAKLLKDDYAKLLKNHPIYFQVIEKLLGYELTENERKVYYWAQKQKSGKFIAEKLGLDYLTLTKIIENLNHLEVLQILPISENHLRLQNFLVNQTWTEKEDDRNVLFLWQKSQHYFGENNYLISRSDGVQYSFQEINQIVKYITETLLHNGLERGDVVVCHAQINVESISLFWACMHCGLVFVPICDAYPDNVFCNLVEEYEPKIIFLNHKISWIQKPKAALIYFEEVDVQSEQNSKEFSDWLVDEIHEKNLPKVTGNDVAVIIHTSGSAGKPKGVALSHSQLFSSAEIMTNSYHWDQSDKYIALGQLDSMSGLRNTCLVTARSGAVCIIPKKDEINDMEALLDCIVETKASILVTSPSLYYQLALRKNAKNKMSKIRLCLSTGGKLTVDLKKLFHEKTAKYIYNYYGLTETSGICIYEPLGFDNYIDGAIGFPIDCHAKIIDDQKNVVGPGKIGELCIYSENISNGYFQKNNRLIVNPQIDKEGWLHTNDLAQYDETGVFYLAGRKTEFIKNAHSQIIHFAEIEHIIRTVDSITDTAVISYFKNETENIAIFITLTCAEINSEKVILTLKTLLKESLALHSIPSIIKVIQVIPRNSNGKIIKQKLIEIL